MLYDDSREKLRRLLALQDGKEPNSGAAGYPSKALLIISENRTGKQVSEQLTGQMWQGSLSDQKERRKCKHTHVSFSLDSLVAYPVRKRGFLIAHSSRLQPIRAWSLGGRSLSKLVTSHYNQEQRIMMCAC